MPLELLKETCDSCTKCELYKGNKQSVVYRGNPLTAKIVFQSEAPGQAENDLGVPLIGPAGQVLQRALDKIGLTEDDFLCTNTVLHRPPNNRVPTREEQDLCFPYVSEVITSCPAKVLVLLGSTPLKYHHPLGVKASITILRGIEFNVSIGAKTYKTIPTFHSSYVMRLEGSDKGKEIKKLFWEDLNKAWELANV